MVNLKLCDDLIDLLQSAQVNAITLASCKHDAVATLSMSTHPSTTTVVNPLRGTPESTTPHVTSRPRLCLTVVPSQQAFGFEGVGGMRVGESLIL